MTDAEKHLWEAIRNKQVAGLRFRSQHPVGRFVLDFYCPSHKLVIEVDGSSHAARSEYDQERTACLEQYGYTVLRFSNEEVIDNLPAVVQKIQSVAEEIR